MSHNGNTILSVIHYPALGENSPKGAVRSAQHEDINLITLLGWGNCRWITSHGP